MKENLKFPQYLLSKERTVSVAGLLKDISEDIPSNYTNGKGYIDPTDDSIWIYCRKKPNKLRINTYPYFWFTSESNREHSNPPDDIRDKYNAKNLHVYDVHDIINDIKDDEIIYSPEELVDISNSSSELPIIKPSDDFLKKIIKMIIITKNINIKRLKVKMGVPYKLPNMITALNNDTKMSTTYFATWLEILGLEVEYKIKNDGTDNLTPLKHEHIYEPATDTFYVVMNGSKIPVDMKQYYEKPNS